MKMKKTRSQRLSFPDYSKASITFAKNSYSVHRLFTIHEEINGDKDSKKYKTEVLNKSAFIFITAYWEAYVEDVCKEISGFLLSNCSNYNQFPQKGRLSASRKLLKSQDQRKVWELAGDGWKRVVNKYVEEFLNNFHTPSPYNVNDLFDKLLGLTKITSSWKWQGMSSVKAQSKLEGFINTRHEIAHGKPAPTSVTKKNAESYLNLVETIVQKTDKYLRDYAKKLTNRYP